MDSAACDHVLYVDDRDSDAELHLTPECGRRGLVNGHEVDEEHCAAALDGWLRANPGKVLSELLVTTSRIHHGRLRPVVEVLAEHRPEVQRLGVGALAFPDSGRGDYVPNDLSRDGSSWSLSVPLEDVFGAVPSLRELVVQCNDVSMPYSFSKEPPPPFPEMACLRRLVLRDEAMNPAVVAALGTSSFPRLEPLELWLGHFEYSWGGSVEDLVPLLKGSGFGELRRLTLVSDLEEGLVDALADSALVGRLESLRLLFGVVDGAGASRLRERWSDFGHLRRLDLTGNAIPAEEARALQEIAPEVVRVGSQRMWLDEPRFAPPLVSLFDAWRR